VANPLVNAAIRRLIQAGYPESTARKIASGELSMDPAAKAGRMSEQGYFDIYHGGAGDISAFDPAKFGGSTTGAKSAQMATWGVDDPRVAETYARYAGEDVPVQRLIQEADAAGRRGDFDLQERLYLQAEALEQSGELVGGGGQNVMPLMARGNYLDKDAKGGTLSDLDEGQIAQWVQEAKDKGYDGVRIRDFSDNADYGVYLPATHYGILDPTKIRSRFAAFDPDELDNPNILAGLAPYAVPTAFGGTILGAAMAPEEAEAAVESPLDRQDNVPEYMRRLDGTVKSERGFLGPIRNKVSGKTMTEVSIGQPGSEEGFYPLLVPTLTPEEVETIANMDLERERPPFSIIEKARAHAMERIDRGLSPFYQDGEEGGDVTSPLDRPEDVERRANARAVSVASNTLERLRRERGPRMAPLRSNAGTAFGDYLTENRPSEMDPVQRALQNLEAFQGLGEWVRTSGEGQRTTLMQDINAALDIVPL
jgi:hypothetical protein